MEKVKIIKRCSVCGKPTEIELNFFQNKKDTVPCRCDCEKEAENDRNNSTQHTTVK